MQTLGLTCISEELKLKDKKKYSFRTMTRKRFNDLCVQESKDEAIKQLSERIIHNLRVTQYILRHCTIRDINHYRLSSSLFPLLTDQTLGLNIEHLPNYNSIKEELRFIGLIAFSFKISMSIHPDQFNVLASLNQDAVDKTIKELNFQAEIMDMMGLPQDHTAPMNIHINYTPKMDEGLGMVADRFYKNLMRCDEGVFNRLTIENEDKGFFNVDNCINFSEYLFHAYNFNLPVCYDNLHDFCNPSEEIGIAFQAERCAYTWVNQDAGETNEFEGNHFLSPVFHWSEGRPDKPRAHADYFALGNFPPHIAIDPEQPAKWECEVKAKDRAIQILRNSIKISNK